VGETELLVRARPAERISRRRQPSRVAEHRAGRRNIGESQPHRSQALNVSPNNWFLSLDDAKPKIEAQSSRTTTDLTLARLRFHQTNLLDRPSGTPALDPGLLTLNPEYESGDLQA
jgi:hypothetical protein